MCNGCGDVCTPESPAERTHRRVVEICQKATSYNFGRTVLESSAHTVVTVVMSSWPRANEAATALRESGYDAIISAVGCTLTVRPAVEALRGDQP